jgi:signal transduction histidine kinase
MTEASLVPRLSLRRKGAALFAAVTAYVIASAGFLGWQMIGVEGAARAGPMIAAVAGAAALGLAVFGAFLTLFLGRLASDLGRLHARAVEVAAGERGPPLAIAREDEVGTLARAVDKMAADLRAREAEIAASRLEQFHAERTLLLGGIAAGVAHEIGNPAAAIAAMAAEIEAAQRAARLPQCDARELSRMANRLAAVTRRLSIVAGLHAHAPGPTLLNDLVECTLPLIALEARFRAVEISTELAPGLPAVCVAEDDFMQLLMHLLVNAVEAFEGVSRQRPRIRVATRSEGGGAVLEVADNGRGMDAATAARAFEPLFTTKPAGRGNGLGLDACRRIAARHGGRISLESRPGEGTSVRCAFPPVRLDAGGAVIDWPARNGTDR